MRSVHHISDPFLCVMISLLLLALFVSGNAVLALNVVLAGGSGPLGKQLASCLIDHDVTILCRNAFLAAAPNRVTHNFGYVGTPFLQKNPHVRLRDWDGGDLLGKCK